MSHHNNLVRIKAVYNAFGELSNQIVFVGGATVSLYADRMAEEVRPTDDIDVLVEIWSRKDYSLLEDQLRAMGFENDQNSKIICRYKLNGIVVDIMPLEEKVLGFSNKWYPKGFENSIEYKIDDQHIVRIFTAPYFIASKLEAFNSRGNRDGRTSSDFEDIVFVMENRLNIWEELKACDEELRQYLKDQFQSLLSNPNFEEWVDAHAAYGSPPATYYIIDQLTEFVST